MLSSLDRFLKKRSPLHVSCVSFVLLFGIAGMDHTTGYEISFSFFYLLPIFIAAWYGNSRLGLLQAVVSAIVWLTMDWSSGHHYSRTIIPIWNAGVRLGFFIVTATLLAKIKSQLEKEQRTARLDGLTGVMNGHAFKEATQTILRISVRHQRPFVMGYIDLDNFKKVNDTMGHAEGDRVIKTVASIMSSAVRKSDLIGRMGGDEFAVFLPETTSVGASTVFVNLRDKLLQEVREHDWPIGFSIGVAVFQTAPSSLEEAIRFADSLMYRVKHGGKNNILFEKFKPLQAANEQSA